MPGTSNSGGRNSKGADQHVLQGTFRRHRHSGQVTPDPPKGRPDPPKEITGESLDEWNRTCDRLEKNGTLTLTDDAAIYQYCRLFAETEELAVLQSETGGSIDRLEENLSGLEGSELVQCFQEITKLRAIESRYVAQIRSGRMAQRIFLVEFGLTPSARSRIRVPSPKTHNTAKKARFFAVSPVGV